MKIDEVTTLTIQKVLNQMLEDGYSLDVVQGGELVNKKHSLKGCFTGWLEWTRYERKRMAEHKCFHIRSDTAPTL